MPYNLLLLPLLGGFIFVRYWNRTRYYTIRADRERLLFLSSTAGFIFLILAFAAKIAYLKLYPCVLGHYCLQEWWRINVPFGHSSISFVAFLIGAVGWLPLNHFWTERREIDRVIQEDADPFELLLKRAQDEDIPILFTTGSGKIYVGFVSQMFKPSVPMRSVGLVPLKSGYRDDKKQVVFNVDYSITYVAISEEIKQLEENLATLPEEEENGSQQRLDIEQQLSKLERISDNFQVVLPLGEISSASFYDEEVDQKYFHPETQSLESLSASVSND